MAAAKKTKGPVVPLPEDLSTVELRNMRNGWCVPEGDSHDRCDPVIYNGGGTAKWLRCPCDCHTDMWEAGLTEIAAASKTAAWAWGHDTEPGTQGALFVPTQ